jgi:N-acetylated-alpha-linked acidic dipeptidase
MKRPLPHARTHFFRVTLLWCSLGPLFLLFHNFGQTAPNEDKPMLGFSREGAARQRALEARFDASLKRENLRDWMKRLTARPHHLGSAYDKANAEFIASQLRSWGYETEIEEFEVLFPTPKLRLVEMTAPAPFTAALKEPALAEDSTSGLVAEQLPTYNAYSIDGDVTSQLVYVNFGVPKDYETLAERGVDVKGKIVIARYGGAWRGIKPKVAAEHGAIGCLIYSDPHEDGYFQGDEYPQGAFRNAQGAQRGSVADMPLYAGDPLTPGIGAVKNAKRLPRAEAPSLTKIPVLPLAQADALPLLRALGGPVAPEDWRGALPLTYHLGPGPANVHLKVEFNWDLVPLYNVIGKMPGAERAHEWVLRGNHHDAWVCGADDPISGTVDVMEEARAIGELAKSGWKPKRTIVFAFWDGEEPGLLGSTEHAELHAEVLTQHAAVYINGDSNVRGFLHVGGSHTLEKFINEVANEVIDPEKKIPVSQRLRDSQIVKANTEDRREARERADLRISALGSGSDYTPFLQHLGIACLDLRYGGEGTTDGVYHSIYDSFDHYRRFGDPNFDYGIALAQTAGRAVLRFANAEVLPFEFNNFADTIGKYLKEVIKLADDLREEIREKNRQINENTLEAVADPARTYVAPKPTTPPPFFNFAPLQNAVARLQERAQNFDQARGELGRRGQQLSLETQNQLDEILMQTERALLRPDGLPRRAWYKHQVYAPGFYTGYGAKTLPGVREALEQRQWDEVGEQIGRVAETLEKFNETVERATAALKASH